MIKAENSPKNPFKNPKNFSGWGSDFAGQGVFPKNIFSGGRVFWLYPLAHLWTPYINSYFRLRQHKFSMHLPVITLSCIKNIDFIFANLPK